MRLFKQCIYSFSVELKALATSSVNMKRLMKETSNKEPILIIISSGSDPSQELQELATQTVGNERYHQVCVFVSWNN